MMKWFLVWLFMVTSIISIGIDSHAGETGQLMNSESAEIDIKDEAKFLTVRDEKGEKQLIKTIALLRFSEDEIEFEVGKTISTEKTEATIPRYQNPFEQ